VSLVRYNIVAIAETDEIGRGQNVVGGASVAITPRAGGTAHIYSDEAGTTEITLPTVCNSSGELGFWIEAGKYYITVAGTSRPVDI
jgi:hypothetical protein